MTKSVWFRFCSYCILLFSLSGSIFSLKNSKVSELERLLRFIFLGQSSIFFFLSNPYFQVQPFLPLNAAFLALSETSLLWFVSCKDLASVSSEMFIIFSITSSNSVGSSPPSPVAFPSLLSFGFCFLWRVNIVSYTSTSNLKSFDGV